MVVLINSKAYQMPNEKAVALRKQAKTLHPCGIYAIQKQNKMELRRDTFQNKNEMKQAVKRWNAAGFIVFWNWG